MLATLYPGTEQLAVRTGPMTRESPPQLEPKQIGHLHEKQAPVIDQPVSASQQARVGIEGQLRIDVLEIAVVTDINRGSRMDQICDQKISVELLGGWHRGEGRIGQRRRVLQDHAEGQLTVDLPVPLGPDDVVIEDA